MLHLIKIPPLVADLCHANRRTMNLIVAFLNFAKATIIEFSLQLILNY